MATLLTIRKSLNQALRKLTIERASFAQFCGNLQRLLDYMEAQPNEREEHYKNPLTSFLTGSLYPKQAGSGTGEAGTIWQVNTSDDIDLTIARQERKGKAITSETAVMLEVKRPRNAGEMMTRDRLNVKALAQLVYYFLQERVTKKNARVRHLVVTNIYEWFVFDARHMEAKFVRDRELVRTFNDFEMGRLSYSTREEFYAQAVAPAIARHEASLEFTYFDLRDYAEDLAALDFESPADSLDSSEAKQHQARLAELYKFFMPEHLAGLPFANDSNTLNRKFYAELLHILGLTERDQKNKKTIERLPVKQRQLGSILENAILQLDHSGKLSRLDDPQEFGDTREEQLFQVALALTIAWLNRILFLKLLEAQLLSHHGGANDYRFLTHDRLRDYQVLHTLFVGVLARQRDDRHASVAAFDAVPYLNSSLFEVTELEHRTIAIDSLSNSLEIAVFGGTVLQDEANPEKQRTGSMESLPYLLAFLDAYDFGREGEGEVRDRSQPLISASVLGLIFEKINGYRDGAVFTPGYVTMSMCRDVLRRAAIQALNAQLEGVAARTFADLQEDVSNFVRNCESGREAGRLRVNGILDRLKICDPAVGSGHFLVSALNELLAIKSELKILYDEDGKTLHDYTIAVENDELSIWNDDSGVFVYRPRNPESLRVQKTLFNEKRRIIEGCLFGADINGNSVKICQLRLWIELLKHAYYTDKSLKNLETLPNIDINIKPGNSVIYQYALRPDERAGQLATSAATQAKIARYRELVEKYRRTRQPQEKRAIEVEIETIKASVKEGFALESAEVKKRTALEKELAEVADQQVLIETEKEKKARDKRAAKLQKEIDKLTAKIEERQQGRVVRKALEWRFEFPEVLDVDNGGEFVGFDVVIGNPPYVRQEEIKKLKPYLEQLFSTYTGVADLFVYFYELGLRLLKPGGYLAFISSNKYFRAGYGEKLRRMLAEETTIASLIDFGDYPVFEGAIAYPSIVTLRKAKPAAGAENTVRALSWDASRSDDVTRFLAVLTAAGLDVPQSELKPDGWQLESREVLALLAKLRGVGVPLGEFVDGRFYYGIKTGLNEAFVVDRETRDRLIAEDARSAEVLKPFLRGKDVKRWSVQFAEQYLIKIESSENKKHTWSDKPDKEAEKIFKQTYPAIWKFINQYRQQLIKRYDQGKYFWELRSCKYWDDFVNPGIIYPDISIENNFAMASGEILDCTLFLIPSNLSGFLTGVLNSSTNAFFFPQICPKIRGGFMRFKSIYVEQIPIPDPEKDPDRVKQIETLVSQILQNKQTDPSADVSDLEHQIDRHVYQLYDLTPDEIAIVEHTTR